MACILTQNDRVVHRGYDLWGRGLSHDAESAARVWRLKPEPWGWCRIVAMKKENNKIMLFYVSYLSTEYNTVILLTFMISMHTSDDRSVKLTHK